eukprot:6049955-Prymnesium_polylepis.1
MERLQQRRAVIAQRRLLLRVWPRRVLHHPKQQAWVCTRAHGERSAAEQIGDAGYTHGHARREPRE